MKLSTNKIAYNGVFIYSVSLTNWRIITKKKLQSTNIFILVNSVTRKCFAKDLELNNMLKFQPKYAYFEWKSPILVYFENCRLFGYLKSVIGFPRLSECRFLIGFGQAKYDRFRLLNYLRKIDNGYSKHL